MYLVGKVLKPQGIKGEVKVEIITSFPEHFSELEHLYIQIEENWQTYSIDSLRLTDKFVFIKFKDIYSIEDTEILRTKELYIPKEELKKLADDEYFIHDLSGIRVYNEQGSFRGEICRVETYTSNDVYILKMTSGKEILIPAIKDVVKKIDISGNKMIIHEMEGLFD